MADFSSWFPQYGAQQPQQQQGFWGYPTLGQSSYPQGYGAMAPGAPAGAPTGPGMLAPYTPPGGAYAPSGGFGYVPGGQTPRPGLAPGMGVAAPGANRIGGPGAPVNAASYGLTPEQQQYNAAQQAGQPNQNLQTIGAVTEGVGTLGKLGLGAYALYQAQQDSEFQKSMASQNMVNSITSYNTSLENRIKHNMGRSGASQEAIQAEIAKKSLSDKKGG